MTSRSTGGRGPGHAAWGPGQATRHGYIVLAPDWAGEHQEQYHYSAREHAMVLGCYRDACRRFAVDTDRVFLRGHSMGGDAAWDIGLAHPDLWAGVIPISAESARYCNLYRENARNLPFYVICGELDGAKMNENARDLDRYLRRGYNATVVEYQGRGHEHFSDETLRLFDWMGRFHREFFPREFNCATMREGDNFFWWVGAGGNAAPRHGQSGRLAAAPRHRTSPREGQRHRPTTTSTIQTGTTRLTVWLAPGMFDFKRPISIVVNGHKMNNRGSNLIAQPGDALGRRPHSRRPPAPILGQVRLSHRPRGAGDEYAPHATPARR